MSRIKFGDHAVVFNVKLLLCSGSVLSFNDMVRHFPHAMDVTFFNEAGFENIFRPPDDFGEVFAFFDAENSGQRFVLDRDCGYRFREEMPVRMGEQQDRLLWMVDDSVRQARLIFADQRDTNRCRIQK